MKNKSVEIKFFITCRLKLGLSNIQNSLVDYPFSGVLKVFWNCEMSQILNISGINCIINHEISS